MSDRPKSSGPGSGFHGETTDEYRLPDGWEKASARAEVSMDSPAALEDTRQEFVPETMRPLGRELPSEQARAQWEERPRTASKLKAWFYSDPLVVRLRMLPPSVRATLWRGAWILAAASMIVGLFAVSEFGIYPMVEEAVRPIFAPKPDYPVRMKPREGYLLDLVEDRVFSATTYKQATDCIWLTPSPEMQWEMDTDAFQLVDGGETIALLDVRANWDGLVRVYFAVGKLPVGKPLHIKVPIRKGGLWPVKDGGDYGLYALGSGIPSALLVGPVLFHD